MSPEQVPQPLPRRPLWIVVLSLIMLLQAAIHDPRPFPTLTFKAAVVTPHRLALDEKLATIIDAMAQGHATALRLITAAGIVVAAVLLYSLAAILSRDPRSRRWALLTAWLILAYQLGTLPAFTRIARDHATQSVPVMVEIANDETAVEDRQKTAEAFSAAIKGEPYLIAVFRGSWALLLIGYFGGRRGRRRYGLEPTLASR